MLKIDSSPPEMKSRKAVEALAKTAVKIIRGDVIGSAFGFYDAYKAYVPENPSNEQLAFMFWRAVFFLSITDALTRNRLARMADANQIESQAAWLLDTVFATANEEEFSLQHLKDPATWPVYREQLRPRFAAFAASLEEAPGFTDKELAEQLDFSLRSSLYKVWSEGLFQAFQRYVASLSNDPVYESVEQRRRWRRHYTWIEHRLSGQPLFGQDKDKEREAGITLRSVYTPLRCAWEVIEDIDDPDGRSHRDRCETKRKRHVHLNRIEETLRSWLDQQDGCGGQDALRVLVGGPGCGKSTVARIFAADTAQKEDFNVCFIELQHFNMQGDLRSSLAHELERSRDGIGLGFDPLKWQDQGDGRPILFVFDGLDELVRHEDLAEDLTLDFIYKVHLFLKDENRGGFRAAALVTGRPAAAEPAFNKVPVDSHALLQVMPMSGLEDHSYFKDWGNFSDQEIHQAGVLLDRDDRAEFWTTWLTASRSDSARECGALSLRELDEFTCEPLLFYLLILSDYADLGSLKEDHLKNRIYRRIFERVHLRDTEKRAERGEPPVSKDHFFLLMECLGLAIWHGGGRTGSEDDFSAIKSWHAGKKANRVLSDMDSTSLKNVAMQFYTRNETSTGDGGFEFIHKSFGEYLTACALVRIGQALAASDDSDEELAEKWLRRTGPAQVTHEIIGFLRDEMALLPEAELSGTLADLGGQLNWVVAHGMPAHKLDNIASWREAETRQRNATGALMAVINACGEALPVNNPQTVAVDWPEESSARRFLDMLHVTSELEHPHGELWSRVEFVRHEADGGGGSIDLASLRLFCVSLNKADLRGAELHNVVLEGADLIRAKLQRAELQGANLQFTDLQRAKLQKADLLGADLQMSNLQRADLQRANLQEANLQKANLQKADLRWANLQGAEMRGANLQEVKLRWANLQGTDAREAVFHLASLASVALNRTKNLTQGQINSAFGDAFTAAHLPKGLVPPEHWAQTELSGFQADKAWRSWMEDRQAAERAVAQAAPEEELPQPDNAAAE